MKSFLRLGFLVSVVGLAAIAGTLVDSVRHPGVGTRVAYAADPVDIELHGGGGFEVISLSTACSNNLYPGLICTDAIQIRNVGELPFEYEIEAWSDVNAIDDGLQGFAGDSLLECINVNVDTTASDGLDVGDQSSWGPTYAGFLQPGATQHWGLEVSVDDDNACQGQQGTIFAYVIATAGEPEGGGSPDGSDASTPSGAGAPPAPGEGGGSGPGGSGSPQPPGAPLEDFVPPATGDAGLIGARPGSERIDTWMVILGVTLMTAGIACACGLQASSNAKERP